MPSIRCVATFTDMYVVTEADAAAIREAYDTGGELSAAVEPRRPGHHGQRHGQGAAWTPLPDRPARCLKGKVKGSFILAEVAAKTKLLAACSRCERTGRYC